MQEGKILAVFCYDISKDKIRNRIIKILDDHTVRVQESVFEGWMTRKLATAIAERISLLLDETDCFRLYLLSPGDAGKTIVQGPTPPVESHDFYLL